jgi:hypothetical protein
VVILDLDDPAMSARASARGGYRQHGRGTALLGDVLSRS